VVLAEISKRHRIVVSLPIPRVELLLDKSAFLGEDLVEGSLMAVQLRDRLLSDLALGARDRVLDETSRNRREALAGGHPRTDPQRRDSLSSISFGEARDPLKHVLVDGAGAEPFPGAPREDVSDRVLAVGVEVDTVGDANPGSDSVVKVCKEVDLTVRDADPRKVRESRGDRRGRSSRATGRPRRE